MSVLRGLLWIVVGILACLAAPLLLVLAPVYCLGRDIARQAGVA